MANTKTGTDNIKTEYSSIFSTDRVGNIGILNDGTYNVPWVIYTISDKYYQLFPLRNLTYHRMNPTDTNTSGYEGSEMYVFIHSIILPNLRKSGLNITDCDLVSESVYNDICSKTGKISAAIAGGEGFWLTDPHSSNYFCIVDIDGGIFQESAGYSLGVRPLITVVK